MLAVFELGFFRNLRGSPRKLFLKFVPINQPVRNLVQVKVAEAFVPSERVAVAVLNTTIPPEESQVVQQSQEHNMEEINIQCTGYGYGRVSRVVDNLGDDEIKGQYYIATKHCHCLEWIRSPKSPVDIMRPRNVFLCDVNGKLAESGFCLGDNGGPLMCGGALRAIATAIFHYKNRGECKLLENRGQTDCGSIQSLNVFTDVCYFGDWLHSTVPSYPHLDELCKVVPGRV